MNLISRDFLPFTFLTPMDRVRAFSVLSDYRRNNLPIPTALGILLVEGTDAEMRKYFLEIRKMLRPKGSLHNRAGHELARKALEILGFFHGIKCEHAGKGKCLGRDIFKLANDVENRIHDFTP